MGEEGGPCHGEDLVRLPATVKLADALRVLDEKDGFPGPARPQFKVAVEGLLLEAFGGVAWMGSVFKFEDEINSAGLAELFRKAGPDCRNAGHPFLNEVLLFQGRGHARKDLTLREEGKEERPVSRHSRSKRDVLFRDESGKQSFTGTSPALNQVRGTKPALR